MPVTRIVTDLCAVQGATFAPILAAFDAALTVLMDGIIAAPPPGYQEGSIRLEGAPNMIYDHDNTVYTMWQQFSYQTVI